MVLIYIYLYAKPILESKGMRAIFQKKRGGGKKCLKSAKKSKIFENLCKIYKI